MPKYAVLFCILWGAGIIIGLSHVSAYSHTPTDRQPSAQAWPVESGLRLASDRSTLLISLHPRCTCSHATLTELARLLARVPTPVQVEILVYQPGAESPVWTETDLVRTARSIPGVRVRLDPRGLLAARFGMSSSGHTALYAPDGRMLFRGGITYARGHEGDNAGSEAILSILSRRHPDVAVTPVFGCTLREQT